MRLQFDYCSEKTAIILLICQLIAIFLTIPQVHISKLLNKLTNFEWIKVKTKRQNVKTQNQNVYAERPEI